MNDRSRTVLIIGEVFVDFTSQFGTTPAKVRLGGIVHAARALWAAEIPYAVAAICPKYLVEEVKQYLKCHGCTNFHWLAEVVGSPNVILIRDPLETSHQGYEDILRDKREVSLSINSTELNKYSDIVVFTGHFEISALTDLIDPDSMVSFDVAYDLVSLDELEVFKGRLGVIALSTSSELFVSLGSADIDPLAEEIRRLAPEAFLLKENRGGSRMFDFQTGIVESIPAVLGETVNSVGVGDAYTAAMVGCRYLGWNEAAWRGSQVATEYSQSTFPDDLKRNVQRGLKVDIQTLRNLEGTVLPWHDRRRFPIYLAGPDFSYFHKPEIESAVASLQYHNFNVRRPIQENGELQRPASPSELMRTYALDLALLHDCSAVYAIPLQRDPGTLVEMGIAIALGKPVITYDPRNENENTMVTEGSFVYSSSLDACLNATFNAIAMLRQSNG